jgi:hypothetical protein
VTKRITRLPSQIELVSHIAGIFGARPVEPRLLNAIVNAANSILAEFKREPVMATPGMGLQAWLQCDDRGLSSQFLAAVLHGFVREFAYPHDGADFGRCVRMLRAAPAGKKNWDRIKNLAQPWPTLAAHWEELERLFEEEANGTQPAGRFYGRLHELYASAGLR